MAYQAQFPFDTPVSRRTALRALAATASAVVLAACGSASQPAPSSASPSAALASPAAATASKPAAPSAAPASAGASTAASAPAAAGSAAGTSAAAIAKPATSSAPRPGGTLRVGIPADIASLDGIVRGSYDSVWLVYDRLVTYDEKLKPQPMLAESWDLNSDYSQITLHLRKGVTWHSGREFTSDDVKWNFLRVRDPKAGYGDFATQSGWFTTIDTPDKNTIVLKSDAPRPAMFDLFQQFNMGDQPSLEGPDAKTKAVGTGPFVFKEWVQGDHVTVNKNPNYWQTGRPYLDSIVNTIRGGDQPTLAALEGGQSDIISTSSYSDVARLKQDPKYTVWLHPSPGTFYEFAFLTTVKPFDNKVVRQAFNWAINRQRIADTFKGFASPIDLQWYTSSPGYDEAKNKAYTFDLAKAKALLQQAGVSNLSPEIIVAQTSPLNSLGGLQIYQADLATLGVNLKITQYDQASWANHVLGHDYGGMYATVDVIANLYPIDNLNGPTWRPAPNNTAWDTPEWKDLFTKVASEADATKQKALYGQMNDYILDQSWAMPVTTGPAIRVSTAKVKGLTTNQYGAWYYTDAYLEA
ncbi:MAG TPA: ABC transporter substrate-binding protein [Chloroflexota bacterium]|nr:ABC transporter substrate-binding protein [Chloroflexota bacterium]